MRNLIMGLLLANLLLLAWGQWILTPDAINPLALDGVTEPRLVLVKSQSRAADSGVTPVEDGKSCFRLGPFSFAGAAADVGDQLSARGLPVDRTSESRKIWVGHWVQLLDFPSIEIARQALRELVSVGLADAYISAREPTVDISLGVFRSRQGADNVTRAAGGLGYTPVWADRFRDEVEHWVEVTMPTDQPPDLGDLRVTTSGEAQIIRVERQSCGLSAENISVDDGDGADDSLESRTLDTGSLEPSILPE